MYELSTYRHIYSLLSAFEHLAIARFMLIYLCRMFL